MHTRIVYYIKNVKIMFVHIQCRSVHALCQSHIDVHEYGETSVNTYTVKPVFSGHHWEKEKVAL
jgi:hypothetical protein